MGIAYIYFGRRKHVERMVVLFIRNIQFAQFLQVQQNSNGCFTARYSQIVN
jgi:hypothetical protein